MVEVLKRTIGYELECPHCKSLLKVGMDESEFSVNCPVCDRDITTRTLNGELSSRLIPIYEEKGCSNDYI